MWRGAVSFGLVSVPVKLYSATHSHDIGFRQVHREDGGQIRYQRTCSVCGEEVPYGDIAKGYTSEDGRQVVLTDGDLAELPVASSREIAVDRFVPADQIDPMLLDRTYYLEPEKSGIKAYALLREALRESDRMGLVKVAIRNRASMAVLRVHQDVIVLQTMLWPDEIRSTAELSGLDDDVETKPQELAMASSLVDTMAGDFEPEELHDDYRDAVESLISGKMDKGESRPTPDAEPEEDGAVLDLLSALQKSVAAAKVSRGEEPEESAAKHPAPKKTGKKSA